MLSLPYLPTRRIMGKEPLGDYFQSHVVILVKYLNILREKTMDKVIQRKLKKERKERKDK